MTEPSHATRGAPQAIAGPSGGADGAEVGAAVPKLSEFDTSAWGRLTSPDGGIDCGTLGELMDALDSNADLRSAALLRSLERYRDTLDVLPSDCPLDQPLSVRAVDVMVLVRAVLSRLR